jgi:hypothetical protein
VDGVCLVLGEMDFWRFILDWCKKRDVKGFLWRNLKKNNFWKNSITRNALKVNSSSKIRTSTS